MRVSAGDVSITIVTSEKYLLKSTSDRSEPNYRAFESALASMDGRGWARPTVLVMKGRKSPLHDRFLVADGRVWLSGNSLNAIGRRASVMIELPNPQEIMGHIAPLMDQAEPFEDWIKGKEPRAGRRRRTIGMPRVTYKRIVRPVDGAPH